MVENTRFVACVFLILTVQVGSAAEPTGTRAFATYSPQTIPFSCATALRIILPSGKIVSLEDIDVTLNLAQQPQIERQKYLSEVPVEKLFEELRRALFVRWQIRTLDRDEISAQRLPTEEALLKAYPSLRGGKNVPLSEKLRFGFSKELLEKQTTEWADELSGAIGTRSSATARKEMLRVMLGDLNHHGKSWYHQTRVDRDLDRILGLHTEEVTKSLQGRTGQEGNSNIGKEETYNEASSSMLLTPYHEMRGLLSDPVIGLKPGSKVVDLGAGMGRLGIYLAVDHPGVEFTGYEIVSERAREGQRAFEQLHLGSSVKLLEQDLSDPSFKPEAADVYYAFNPVSGPTFDKILEDLRVVGLQSGKRFKLVVFGPAPFEKTEAQPWLHRLSGPGHPNDTEIAVYEFNPEVAQRSSTVHVVGRRNIQSKKEVGSPEVPSAEIPAYPNFRPVSEGDETTLRKLTDGSFPHGAVPFSFLSPNYLFPLAKAGPVEISQKDGAVLIRLSQSGSQKVLQEPLGVSPEKRAELTEELLRPSGGRRADTPEIMVVGESVKGILEQKNPQRNPLSIVHLPNDSDYVFPLSNLQQLSGSKSLRYRRKQLENFDSNHPFAQLVEVQSATPLHKQSQEFLNNWKLRAQGESPPETTAKGVSALKEGRIAEELNQRTDPNLMRFALTDNGQMLGYAVGEAVKMQVEGESGPTSVFVLYVQKTDGVTSHSVVKLNHAIASFLGENRARFGEIKYMNFMDDGGMENLRRFKRDYSPLPNAGHTYGISVAP